MNSFTTKYSMLNFRAGCIFPEVNRLMFRQYIQALRYFWFLKNSRKGFGFLSFCFCHL